MPKTPGNKHNQPISAGECLCLDNQCPHCNKPVPAVDELCSRIDALQAKINKLDKLVVTDALTELFNFRYIHQALDQEFERTLRTGQDTSLILLDLDHFKQVNDQWGHDAGNQALQQTAALINNTTRKLDIPCRYGGEEFLIILPSTDLRTGTLVAERLRIQIETTPLMIGKEKLHLTASAGVDSFTPTSDFTPEMLIKRADNWLYKAKTDGRNRVCSGSLLQQPTTNVSSEEKAALFGGFGNQTPDEDHNP
ncbi:GGDEF domain-containing protein [Aestuariicella sp. G3-2]|uniref:GGDEF domain-containing protein n=1 Tax=Pseudomaricurvus albidus TaxID=2842452 RepID=UPI001C0B802C|nr:GGDEF domain-containing protein [Aestuariicella albida]